MSGLNWQHSCLDIRRLFPEGETALCEREFLYLTCQVERSDKEQLAFLDVAECVGNRATLGVVYSQYVANQLSSPYAVGNYADNPLRANTASRPP